MALGLKIRFYVKPKGLQINLKRERMDTNRVKKHEIAG